MIASGRWQHGGGAVVGLSLSSSGVNPTRLIAKLKSVLFDIGPSQNLTMGIRIILPPGAKGQDGTEALDNCVKSCVLQRVCTRGLGTERLCRALAKRA